MIKWLMKPMFSRFDVVTMGIAVAFAVEKEYLLAVGILICGAIIYAVHQVHGENRGVYEV